MRDRSVFEGRRSPQAQAHVDKSELAKEVQALEMKKRKLVLQKEIQELEQDIKAMEVGNELRS